MNNPFFDHPILNSPYEYPTKYWELDAQGQPTQRIIESRPPVEFITPIPKPRKRKGKANQQKMVFDEGEGLSTQEQQYDPHGHNQRCLRASEPMAKPAKSQQLAGDSRNSSASLALASSQVQQHPALLLSSRSG